MAKIRGIKPEFWTDDDVCEASIPARILFIGMWNWACDNGHLQDKPKQIKRRILPADDVSGADLLDELTELGLVVREDGWLTIPNLPRHQKVDRRYFTVCDHPACAKPEGGDSERKSRRVPDEDTTGARRVHGGDTVGPRGDGDGDGDGDSDGDGDKKKTTSSSGRAQRGSRLAEDWRPSEATRDRLAKEHPNVDQSVEFWNFQDYWLSKAGKDATKTDWDRTYSMWIRKSATNSPTGARNLRPVPESGLVVNEHIPGRTDVAPEDLPW